MSYFGHKVQQSSQTWQQQIEDAAKKRRCRPKGPATGRAATGAIPTRSSGRDDAADDALSDARWSFCAIACLGCADQPIDELAAFENQQCRNPFDLKLGGGALVLVDIQFPDLIAARRIRRRAAPAPARSPGKADTTSPQKSTNTGCGAWMN